MFTCQLIPCKQRMIKINNFPGSDGMTSRAIGRFSLRELSFVFVLMAAIALNGKNPVLHYLGRFTGTGMAFGTRNLGVLPAQRESRCLMRKK